MMIYIDDEILISKMSKDKCCKIFWIKQSSKKSGKKRNQNLYAISIKLIIQ